jgi:hypothetical protein
MFHAKDGLYFERQADGGVRVLVKADAHEEAATLREVIVDADSWASVIANMSYYGEEDYGFYRASNFHSGTKLRESTPLKDKPPLWTVK